MIDTHINKQPLNRVTAIFADGSLSFLLPQGATLEHIADCVDDLGVRRERTVIAVVVKFAATALKVPRQNWLPFRTGLLAELPGFERLPDPWLVTPTVQTISCKKHSPKPGHTKASSRTART